MISAIPFPDIRVGSSNKLNLYLSGGDTDTAEFGESLNSAQK
jgi:hypothetical protein